MTDKLSRCFRQVMVAQAVIALSITLLSLLFAGKLMALSVVFGALVAFANTYLSKRSVQKSSELAYHQDSLGMTPLVFGWLQRLFLFCAAIIIGVKSLALLPLGIVVGFAITQLGYLACKMQ